MTIGLDQHGDLEYSDEPVCGELMAEEEEYDPEKVENVEHELVILDKKEEVVRG